MDSQSDGCLFFVELQLEQKYNFIGTTEELVKTVALINSGVITTVDLEGFSDELRESVDFLLHR